MNSLLAKLEDVVPHYEYELGYVNGTDPQDKESFSELFEKLKTDHLSSFRQNGGDERASILHRTSTPSRSALMDLTFWENFYDWKTIPVCDRDALAIIDAVQLNRVKNHFSPHHHMEGALPRRHYSRVVPQFTADLDLERSARIFPLNIAQDSSMSESSILFLLNIKAVSALATLIDGAASEFNALMTIVSHRSPLRSSIDAISSTVYLAEGESFESALELHATMISLEQVVIEKQIRVLVDQTIHRVSNHVLNIEKEQKLLSIDNFAKSNDWCEHVKDEYRNEDVIATFSNEIILEAAITSMEHGHNLYLLAHEYLR